MMSKAVLQEADLRRQKQTGSQRDDDVVPNLRSRSVRTEPTHNPRRALAEEKGVHHLNISVEAYCYDFKADRCKALVKTGVKPQCDRKVPANPICIDVLRG